MSQSGTDLNNEQQKAVSLIEGPVLILAGAGAGKTKTITERIKHLVETGVSPSSILAITFTNKAAKEMRERIKRGLNLSQQPFVSTFHSLGVYILREQSARAGIKKNFVIFDRDDSKKAIREALSTLGLDPKAHDSAQLISLISKEKGKGVDVSNYQERKMSGHLATVVAQVWLEYEQILTKNNALDFDDLLVKTLRLLKANLEIRQFYQDTWRYIHIDEYQDTNRVQYEISKMLVGQNHNICVVGDMDQNIYSWRGADIKNILNFEKDYPTSQVITLEENYRSTKTILEAANTVIEKNKMRLKKNLFTTNPDGEKIGIFSGHDEVDEAEFVAHKTAALIQQGVAPNEIAVLYRANFQSRVLEEAFMKEGLPYQLLGTRFFERKEVKDIIAYLRASLNPDDSPVDQKRIINVPTRGIGKTTIDKIYSNNEMSLPPLMKTKLEQFRTLLRNIEQISREKKPSETISHIIKISGLENEWKNNKDEGGARLENAYELAHFASRYDHQTPEEGIQNFLADAALQSDQDEMRNEERAVRLMTIHASKGLEFDNIFITGLEEGLFPHQRMNGNEANPDAEEEERRLFYVALTRARKKIFLSQAETRTVFGRKQVNIPSSFIFDIPETLVEIETLNIPQRPRRPLLDIEF